MVKNCKDIFQDCRWWGMFSQDDESSDHAKIMKQNKATMQEYILRLSFLSFCPSIFISQKWDHLVFDDFLKIFVKYYKQLLAVGCHI